MKYIKVFEDFQKINESIWSTIESDYESDGLIYIDAWVILNEEEEDEGRVIATINKETKEVVYKDNRAKRDIKAQEVIKDVLAEL